MTTPEEIPLARPALGEREEELVLEVLRSGRLSLGPMQERFERDFAAFLGVGDAVAVSSGTAGLHLGARGMGWGPGDEVITSPFSFVASANCLLYENVEPVFCDVDPVTLNLDPDAVETAVGEATAGILAVDILGYPADMPALEEIAGDSDLGLLDDACEALGAIDADGVKVGARGVTSVFAFYANKQLTTGEGGMVIPADADAAARLRSERNQGRAPDMGWVDHERVGFNYRLTEIQAALGIAQLERAGELLAARAEAAEFYTERLVSSGAAPAGDGDPDGLVLPCRDREVERRSWFVYAIRLPRDADRDAVVGDLGQRGVGAKAYMPCIHLLKPYRDRFGHRPGELPVAEDASERLLALPFFPGITEAQIERCCEALEEALQGDWT
ncbi:MAG: DegT/DnrJ/EryC1/StrS family aminotransferase [Solirubrobacterales bacterium]